jgi:arylsulfatase A-like enzyme
VILFLLSLAALASAQPRRPNVILVSLDQCQADRLHVYGNPRATSPNLDRMAAEGVRFSRFYSASSWTAPSYASMMTSQYPSRHGVTLHSPRNESALKPDAVTLAELFRKAGYQTAAFVNNSVAGAHVTGRGFDEYDEGQRRPTSITERTGLANPEYQAPAVTARVEGWLDRNTSGPFFLFLLYFEPHSPYNPPPEHDLFKSDAYPDETNTGWDIKAGRLFRWANLGDHKAIERLTQLYDGKIHFADHHFGRVLEHLRHNGLDKNTIVLLTSDHGELLYSHPQDYLTFDHRSLYDQVLHVPGLLWGAGIPKGRTIDALASHIDIAPTLLDLAGLPPKPDAQGESLKPLLTGRKRSVHTCLFHEVDILEPLRAVRDEWYKLILNLRTGRKQLFDSRNDPGDQRDIAEREPDVVARLTKVLDQWRKENAAEQRHRLANVSAVEVVDEVTIGAHLQLTGEGWQMGDHADDFNGGCYWSEPAGEGIRPSTATWRVDNPMFGRWRISLWYGTLPEAASDVPFTVATRAGSKTVRVDQTTNTGAWHELGVFREPISVTLTNQASGRVIADAVKFEPVQSRVEDAERFDDR